MDNIIITTPSAKIREVARTVMEGHGKTLFIAMLIFFLLNAGVSILLDEFFSYTVDVPVNDMLSVPYSIGYGSQIYSMLVGGAFEFGLCMFMITFFRKRTTDLTLIFEGFSHFAKTLGLMLLMSIKIALWTLLFFIPGIIAGFRYSQAFYIMVDHPEYSINQCLKESSRIMTGNKFKYFCLQFSFIGWYFLASLPIALATGFVGNAGKTTIIIVTALLSIPVMMVDLYMLVSFAAFYELAAGNLVIRDINEYEAYEEEKRKKEMHEEVQSDKGLLGEMIQPLHDEEPKGDEEPKDDEQPKGDENSCGNADGEEPRDMN